MKRKTDWLLVMFLVLNALVWSFAAWEAERRARQPIPCDTDTDCMEKNGGNGDPED